MDDWLHDALNDIVNEYLTQQEKTLAKIIEENDFLVGSETLKKHLIEMLPKEAHVIYSPNIVSPNLIYVIKKYDLFNIIGLDRYKKPATVNDVLKQIQNMCTQIECEACPYHNINGYAGCLFMVGCPGNWDFENTED